MIDTVNQNKKNSTKVVDIVTQFIRNNLNSLFQLTRGSNEPSVTIATTTKTINIPESW